MIKSKETLFEVARANVFILKCVSITNITWRVLLDNKKNNNNQKMNWNYAWRNNTF